MPLPVENAYANDNFEMTGHSEDLGRGNYLMTGCSFSNLDDVIQEFTEGKSQNLIVRKLLSGELIFSEKILEMWFAIVGCK